MENKHTRSVSLVDGHIEGHEIANTKRVLLELKSAAEWFTKHGRNTNSAIIGICKRAYEEINRQQEEIKKLENIERFADKLLKKQETEIERLNVELVGMCGACESYKMHYDNTQAEIERLKAERDKEHDYCNHYMIMCAKAHSEAIKEFADKLCEGRVSNDPVVIAVKAELKMTEEKENG